MPLSLQRITMQQSAYRNIASQAPASPLSNRNTSLDKSGASPGKSGDSILFPVTGIVGRWLRRCQKTDAPYGAVPRFSLFVTRRRTMKSAKANAPLTFALAYSERSASWASWALMPLPPAASAR